MSTKEFNQVQADSLIEVSEQLILHALQAMLDPKSMRSSCKDYLVAAASNTVSAGKLLGIDTPDATKLLEEINKKDNHVSA